MRGVLVVQVFLTVIGSGFLLYQSLSGASLGGAAPLTFDAKTLFAIAMAFWLARAAASIVLFFASMRYIAWLGVRLPNPRIVKSARRLLWLGPLLMTVGALVLVGPLIAYIEYLRLLNRVRKEFKSIRAEMALPDVLALAAGESSAPPYE